MGWHSLGCLVVACDLQIFLTAGSFEELSAYWNIQLQQNESSGLQNGILVWSTGRVLAERGVWQIAAIFLQMLEVPVP